MSASHPNVFKLIKTYMEFAEKHPVASIAIAVCVHPNMDAADFEGEVGMEPLLRANLARLDKKIEDFVNLWSLPPNDPSLTKDNVVYNLAHDPLNHDFLIWLVDAEMTRRRAGAPAPLKVSFWCGTDAKERMEKDNRRQWLEKVFRPLLGMIGAVEDFRYDGHHSTDFVPRNITAAVRNGERVPILKSGLPPRHPGSVTITLRESWYWPHRNSNLEAWLRFAKYLRERGEKVIVVRDTEKAFDNFADFQTDSEASLYTAKRMALYEGAKCNLFTSNGPVGLVLFSHAPWLQFVPIEEEGSTYQPNTKKFWKDSNGIEPGEQYPWASETQRLVWGKDSYENIVNAWEAIPLTKELSYGT